MIVDTPEMALNAEGYAKRHSLALADLGNKTTLIREQANTDEIKR